MNERKPIGKRFWIKLGLVPVLMFGFAFALVPLYDAFCDITGFNGRISNSSYDGKLVTEIDNSRKVTVDFLAATAPGFPVKFYPMTKKMDVIPGKMYTVNYYAENRSDEVIIGQAVPSVAPSAASALLKKLDCFCFTNQKFEPKTPVEMPVRFFIDSKLHQDISNITLSYNFLKIKDTSKADIARR